MTIDIGTVLGPYKVTHMIGSGGMGRVYKARDTRLERDVAIKVLKEVPYRANDKHDQFQREAKAIAALSHPNILSVFDIGDYFGCHYVVTELLEGETLRSRLETVARIPWHEATKLCALIADGLASAHAKGIVHCDLKPENIFLLADGRLKILDFGLARSSHETVGHPHSQGTLDYMSPEQVQGEPVGPESDLFTLGIVLYEMITGTRPFQRANPIKTIYAILHQAPEALTNLLEGIPTELQEVVFHQLEKDPQHRFHSASDCAEALRNLVPRLHRPWNESQHPRVAYRKPEFELDLSFLEMPEVRYAQSGDVNIAYQVVGDGPIDLVFVMGWVSHLEYFWRDRHFARFLYRLAGFSRLIVFDKRGTGLSDRVPLDRLPTMEQRMDDVRAVMEAAGSQRAALCGVSEGGPLCALFAATYPEKTLGIVMVGTYAKRIWAPDYPWAPTAEQRARFFEFMRKEWGGPVGIEDRAPSMAHDAEFRRWWATYLRMGASPNAAVALTQMNAEIDVRHVLPNISAPTLVIHRTGDMCLKVEEGRYVAERIPQATLLELPGVDHLPFVGNQDEILDPIESFVGSLQFDTEPDLRIATCLAIRGNLPQALFASNVMRFGGMSMDPNLALFPGPGRAIQCAQELIATQSDIACAVHCGALNPQTGKGEVRDQTNRLVQLTPDGVIWASQSACDLVAGFGFELSQVASPFEIPVKLVKPQFRPI
ncbi:MAG: alpha/beta fold hydrolase [Acidobacteria bacterium]|nr:alpha/beta fold hydrolase [Acidobacteriota bacterium]